MRTITFCAYFISFQNRMGLWERENHLLGFIKGRKVADKYYIKKLMGGLKWGRQKKRVNHGVY